jgi:hypothetical protein
MTPLVGSWADECWGSSRQASEILLNDTDKKETAYPLEDEKEEMQETLSLEVQVSAPESPQFGSFVSNSHVSRCMSYNPYNFDDPCVLHYYCNCAACVALNQTEKEMTYPPAAYNYQTYSAAPEYVAMPPSPPTPLRPASSIGGSPLQPKSNNPAPFVTHTSGYHTAHHVPEMPVEAPISAFMPPPPPPNVMANIMFNEGNSYAESMYFNIMSRWYSKVARVEYMWVAPDDLCPAFPGYDCFEYSFEQWCEMAASWWFAHFEHMQKKMPRYAQVVRYEYVKM